MTYLQRFRTNIHKRSWICSCGRKNSNDDEVCAFCNRSKPEKGAKGEGKIKSKKTEYNGRWFHSAGEASYAQELDFRMRAGEIIDIKPQYKIEIKIGNRVICNYYADFRVVLADQTIQYHEYKGFETQLFALKFKLLNALKDELLEPGAELILIKHQSKWKPRKL